MKMNPKYSRSDERLSYEGVSKTIHERTSAEHSEIFGLLNFRGRASKVTGKLISRSYSPCHTFEDVYTMFCAFNFRCSTTSAKNTKISTSGKFLNLQHAFQYLIRMHVYVRRNVYSSYSAFIYNAYVALDTANHAQLTSNFVSVLLKIKI